MDHLVPIIIVHVRSMLHIKVTLRFKIYINKTIPLLNINDSHFSYVAAIK